jgi:hypothetical protein
MTIGDRDRESPQVIYEWKRLPEVGAFVKYPHSWKFESPSAENANSYRFIPNQPMRNYGYPVGFSLGVFENEYEGNIDDQAIEEFMKERMELKLWDRKLGKTTNIESQGPLRTITGDFDEEQYVIGGKFQGRWSLNRYVLNTNTNTLYVATFNIPDFRKDLFEPVGREMISAVSFQEAV